jgi:hypothetical protein
MQRAKSLRQPVQILNQGRVHQDQVWDISMFIVRSDAGSSRVATGVLVTNAPAIEWALHRTSPPVRLAGLWSSIMLFAWVSLAARQRTTQYHVSLLEFIPATS